MGRTAFHEFSPVIMSPLVPEEENFLLQLVTHMVSLNHACIFVYFTSLSLVVLMPADSLTAFSHVASSSLDFRPSLDRS